MIQKKTRECQDLVEVWKKNFEEKEKKEKALNGARLEAVENTTKEIIDQLRKKFEDDQKIEKHSALDLMNEEMEETQKKDGAKMEKLERMLEEAEKKKHGTFGENRRQGMLKETLLLDICLGVIYFL